MTNFLPIPPEFKPPDPHAYPAHQKGPLIEQFAEAWLFHNSVNTDRTYVPVYWTSYHRATGYGKGLPALEEFWESVKAADPARRFWTICQYDDSTLLDDPDLLTFCAGGNKDSDTPIPLLCDLHEVPSGPRRFVHIASFVGKNTHPVRHRLFEVLTGRPGFSVLLDGFGEAAPQPPARSKSMGVQAMPKNVRFQQPRSQPPPRPPTKFGTVPFVSAMTSSRFALCPRGYGPTSFRLYEALQLGVVPVYVSDRFWLPFASRLDWEKFAILVPDNKIESIPTLLRSITPQRYGEMVTAGGQAFRSHLNMASTCHTIKAILEEEQRA